MGIDQRISKFMYEKNNMQEREIPYDQGDLVRVKVTRIVNYGAFVVTMDEYLLPGLIHHTQIPHGLHLKLNQVLDAKIKHIKDGNKLELSLHYLEMEKNHCTSLKIKEFEHTYLNKDIEEITRFLANEFGVVSEESKAKLEQMIRELGVFRFTMAMMKTLPKFKRDLVFHFLKEVEQMGDQL